MNRRGTSLMEVLIAIFILALGLVSLLTLFPIGFVQMAKSVQDERAAQLAGNAAAYMRMMWKSACEASAKTTIGGQAMFSDPVSLNSFWSAMDDPNVFLSDNDLRAYLSPMLGNKNRVVTVTPTISAFPSNPNPNAPNTVDAACNWLNSRGSLTGASYPVFVDPVGWQSSSGALQMWLAPRGNLTAPILTQTAIPRRRIPQLAMGQMPTPVQVANINMSFDYTRHTIRSCMLQDDMEYSTDGLANMNERLAQYSCAWLLRRDNNNKRSETNVTVVVYHRRSIVSPSDEIAFNINTADNTPGRGVVPVTPTNIGTSTNPTMVFPNSITLTYNAANRPPLRRGSWILDATIDPGQSQGFYYRVTDFTETEVSTGNFQNVLQLETRLRPRQLELAPPTGGAPPRVIVVQDRLLEVFDKGPLEMNSSSRIN